MLVLVSLSLSLASCSPPQPHPAVTAYRQLIGGLSYGDQERVWSLLALKSREMIIRELNAQVGLDHDVSLAAQIDAESSRAPTDTLDLSRVPQSFKISLDWALESPFATQVKLSSAQPPMINVFYASQSWQIPVVYEQNQWRVHLLDARLTPSPSIHR